MITRKCVFIVGAGASADLGLPTGKDLKSRIKTSVQINFREGNSSPPKSPVYDAVMGIPHLGDNIEPVLLAFDQIALNMGTATSIDAFLDNHREDALIVEIGKLAIANSIALAESNSTLAERRGRAAQTPHNYFLNEVLNLAVADLTIHDVEQSLQHLSFVTFNYDRCIERYADLWLVNRFGSQLSQKARSLNVVHVYGSLAHYIPGGQFSLATRQGPPGIAGCHGLEVRCLGHG